LTVAAAIDGIVTSNGVPVNGAQVVAYERGGAGIVRTALQGGYEFPLHRAISDETGRFSIRSVVPGRVYSLTAGLPGLVVREGSEALEVAPGSTGVNIMLEPLFGTVLRFRTEAGAVPRVVASMEEPPPLTVWFDDKNAQYFSGRSISALLARIDIATLADSSRSELAVLCTRSEDSDRLRGGHCEIVFAGYETCQGTFDLDRTHGDLSIQELIVKSHGDLRFGSLHIEVRIPDAIEERLRNVAVDELGTVEFRDPTGATFHVKVRNTGHGAMTIKEFPAGHYEANFCSTTGFLATRETAVVNEGQSTTLRFDFQAIDFGSIECRFPRDPLGGESFTGPAYLQLSGLTGQRPCNVRAFVLYKRAPYFVPLVSPGKYRVLMVPLNDTRAQKNFTGSVTVTNLDVSVSELIDASTKVR
jgi:hypothetical protein